MRMARENTGWGYDRIVGALTNLGHRLSDQTVGNILRRHGIAPAPKRSQTTSWKDFITAHKDVLAGTDFFTVEVLSWRGLVIYYVLFFLHVESRRVSVAGITRHPDQEWMETDSRQKSESERLCGTLGSVRQGGVSVEVDSVRRRPTVPDPGRVQRALSRRTQS